MKIINEKAYNPIGAKVVTIQVELMLDPCGGAWHNPVDFMNWVTANCSYVQNAEMVLEPYKPEIHLDSDFCLVENNNTCVIIQDLDGTKSVFDDAESVVAYMYDVYGPKQFFYYDSDAYIRELIHYNGVFSYCTG